MYRAFGKRLFDVLASLVLLAVLGPVLLLVAAVIRLKLGSPVLFRQTRPGLKGRPFTILKFRTMIDPLPGQDAFATDAIRTPPLGRFLRRSSLDEFPELLNVLKGEMSLVGPRPLKLEYLDRYTPEQARRHDAVPGITGWAQVNGRNSVTWEKKFELDVWYVDHLSLALDLRILWLTVFKVLKPEGIVAETAFMGSKEKKG